MRIAHLLVALFTFIFAVPGFAQTSTQSSPEDRTRFAAIVHKLELTPLDTGLKSDRAWAIQWLTEAPDVSVTVCSEPLGGVSDEKYAHFGEVVVQYTLGMAAFIIENPTRSSDADATQLGGVESALKAYRSILTAKPGDKALELDKLLALQERGELADFVHKAASKCLAGSAV